MACRRHWPAVLGGVLAWVLWCAAAGSAAEHYVIVPQKSQLQFKAYSLLAKPLGTFRVFSGHILADAQQLSASSVRLTVETASIDTDNAKRDKHLRSEDFFFVEKYPSMTFVSTAITGQPPRYTVEGDLVIRGVTKRITVPVTIEQRADELVVQGKVVLNRQEFGMTYNLIFNPLQDMVDILFTIIGVRQ